MIISLTGFMGCGKSSVGRRLSQLLCCPFMDLDDVIVEREGRSIPDIFASDGETAFRQMELEALQAVLKTGSDMVLALGGGTVMTPACAQLLQERTRCIYMRASTDTLVTHLTGEDAGRPMLQGQDLRSRIEELMEMRSVTYESIAHETIDTDGLSIEETARHIIEICD